MIGHDGLVFANISGLAPAAQTSQRLLLRRRGQFMILQHGRLQLPDVISGRVGLAPSFAGWSFRRTAFPYGRPETTHSRYSTVTGVNPLKLPRDFQGLFIKS